MNNQYLLIIIVVGIVILSIFLIYKNKKSSKEGYSYSFGFPTWGQVDNRLHGIATPYFDFYRTNPFVNGNYPYGYPYNYNYDYPREIITQPLITPPFYPQSMFQTQIVPVKEFNPFMYYYTSPFEQYYRDSIYPYLNNSGKRCYNIKDKHEQCQPGFSNLVRIGNDKSSYQWQCCK